MVVVSAATIFPFCLRSKLRIIQRVKYALNTVKQSCGLSLGNW